MSYMAGAPTAPMPRGSDLSAVRMAWNQNEPRRFDVLDISN